MQIRGAMGLNALACVAPRLDTPQASGEPVLRCLGENLLLSVCRLLSTAVLPFPPYLSLALSIAIIGRDEQRKGKRKTTTELYRRTEFPPPPSLPPFTSPSWRQLSPRVIAAGLSSSSPSRVHRSRKPLGNSSANLA